MAEFDLARIQRWMQTVVTHPGGVVAGVASEAARRQLDVSLEDVEQVIFPSATQTSIQRLQIYGDAYFARLLECLRAEYPGLVHALGQETFDAFAFGYLHLYPSRSYTLNRLGASFPDFLRETRPAQEGTRLDWPEFLIELATLERLYNEVFDGPGSEGDPPFSVQKIAGLTPDQWLNARLVPVECLRLLSLRFPAHEYISAVRRGEHPAGPVAADTWLVVTRRDYIVRRYAVPEPAFALLTNLAAGRSVGDAIAAVMDRPEASSVDLENRIGDWFRAWSEWGLFNRVELASGQS